MTPKERAIKICQEGPSIKNWMREEYIDFLSSHIAEAERDAKAKAGEIVREKYFMAMAEEATAEEWLAAQIEAMK